MKTGLVLEGGGAKGAFHCGAIKALYDHGYSFDGVAGTSIGAINAAFVVQDKGYDTLMGMWTHILPSAFTDFDYIEVEKLYNKELDAETIAYWAKQVLKVIKNRGISTDKALEYLKRNISEEKVRKSDMDLGIVTYCLSDREPMEVFLKDIPQGSLHNYLLASAYYPAFRIDKLEGKYFIDGGVYDNMPIAFLAKNGYEKIIAIRTMSKMPYKKPDDPTFDVEYICPSEDLGRTMQVSAKNINYNIKLGYYDAMRFLSGYVGKRYYIDGTISEIKKLIFAATERNNIDKTEFLKEVLSFYPGLPQDEAIIDFIEEYAYLCCMEKFFIYKPEQFINELFLRGTTMNKSETKIYKIVMREKSRKDELFFHLVNKKENLL